MRGGGEERGMRGSGKKKSRVGWNGIACYFFFFCRKEGGIRGARGWRGGGDVKRRRERGGGGGVLDAAIGGRGQNCLRDTMW